MSCGLSNLTHFRRIGPYLPQQLSQPHHLQMSTERSLVIVRLLLCLGETLGKWYCSIICRKRPSLLNIGQHSYQVIMSKGCQVGHSAKDHLLSRFFKTLNLIEARSVQWLSRVQCTFLGANFYDFDGSNRKEVSEARLVKVDKRIVAFPTLRDNFDF